jgi:2-polyprenyl-6-methoxyphenol hydroxylase-like FAD-dependent oxidoreductase
LKLSRIFIEHTAVIGNFACEKNHLRTAYQWFLDNGDVLALLPLPEKRVSMVWSTSAEHASELANLAQKHPAQFCQIINSQASGQVFEYFRATQLTEYRAILSIKTPTRKAVHWSSRAPTSHLNG